MAIAEFNALLQNKVYKDWLKNIDKNIVTASTKALRGQEESASKTSFYITEDTLQKMYKTITGVTLDSFETSLLLEEIRGQSISKSDKTLVGKNKKVAGQNAIFFENIGFGTITERLTQALNKYPEVSLAYEQAETKYFDEQTKLIKADPLYQKLTSKNKQDKLDAISFEAKRRATFGFYFNKGHVISVAANLARQFKQDIEKADKLAVAQRNLLTDVLDKYIDKLVRDDLATANLPNAINQEMYARYIKSSDSYLVEIQIASENIEAGASSIPIVNELRAVFSGKALEKTLIDTLKKSKALGESLISSQGSPSVLQLIEDDIVAALQGRNKSKKVYRSPKVLVGSSTLKIIKPKKNTSKITNAKKLKSKTASVKSNPKKILAKPPEQEVSLISLQYLLNANLAQVIKENMGTGSNKTVLNLRSGRLAESAKVERLSESRAGMITAFYTYMKNPYATFSQGGRQSQPSSRDPKLLISSSIRQIAATQVGNRMRAAAL